MSSNRTTTTAPNKGDALHAPVTESDDDGSGDEGMVTDFDTSVARYTWIGNDARVFGHMVTTSKEGFLACIPTMVNAMYYDAWLVDESSASRRYETGDWIFYAVNYTRIIVELTPAGVTASDYASVMLDLMRRPGPDRGSQFIFCVVNGICRAASEGKCPVSDEHDDRMQSDTHADVYTVLRMCTVDWGVRQQELLRLYIDEFCEESFEIGFFVNLLLAYSMQLEVDEYELEFTERQMTHLCTALGHDFADADCTGVDEEEKAHGYIAMMEGRQPLCRLLMCLPVATRTSIFGSRRSE